MPIEGLFGQIVEMGSLRVCWKSDAGEVPRDVEKRLMEEFRQKTDAVLKTASVCRKSVVKYRSPRSQSRPWPKA